MKNISRIILPEIKDRDWTRFVQLYFKGEPYLMGQMNKNEYYDQIVKRTLKEFNIDNGKSEKSLTGLAKSAIPIVECDDKGNIIYHNVGMGEVTSYNKGRMLDFCKSDIYDYIKPDREHLIKMKPYFEKGTILKINGEEI